MIQISELFQLFTYILLMVLIIALTILTINAIRTLNKVDRLVDDITLKSNKLNGLFDVIDGTTNVVARFSDSIVSVVTSSLSKIFKRKRDENE